MYGDVIVLPYEPAHPKKIEAVSKIFQLKVQVPAVVRKSINVTNGDKIVWILQDGKWVVEKA